MGVLDRTRRAIPSSGGYGALYLVAPPVPVPAQVFRLPGFVMEPQSRTQWCWAAVTASVDTYYNEVVRVDQCRVASLVLSRNCCRLGCNRPNRLDRGLRSVGRFRALERSSAGDVDVQAEFEAGRPTGVLIRWRGGGGHFVAIAGVQPNPQGLILHVDDPRTGSRHTLLSARLRSGYKGTGDWTATYFTQS